MNKFKIIEFNNPYFEAFLIPEGWLSDLLSCFSSFPGWVCPREITLKITINVKENESYFYEGQFTTDTNERN